MSLSPAEISALPPTAIVLAGNWESTGPQRQLSLETSMRLGGFAVYREHHADAVTAFFTGGLKAQDGTGEASAMLEDWRRDYDALCPETTIYVDDDCYDTSTSARNTRDLMDTKGHHERVTLITSETHMSRSMRTFERHGFKGTVVPATAEELLFASSRPEDRARAQSYVMSGRYFKRMGIEWLLRGIQRVDPNDKLAQLASRTARPNR